MRNKETEFIADFYESHKGFYNDENPEKILSKINYSDFFIEPDNDEEFQYSTASSLLCGSCHIFALSLKEILGYKPYIIEGINRRGFHAFCQVYKNFKWYYIDARGITSSFKEFMDVAQRFVSDEYIIRPVNDIDIEEWKKDSKYDQEAFAFAKAIINKFKECYIFD